MPSRTPVIRPDANPGADSDYLGCGVDVNRSELYNGPDPCADLLPSQYHDVLTYPDRNDLPNTKWATEWGRCGNCGRQPVGSGRRR
jgi:hypothetical protein